MEMEENQKPDNENIVKETDKKKKKEK